MSKRLKRHETLPNSTEDGGDSPEDGLALSSPPLHIADPRIFMLSEAVKNTLESSFTGLRSTLRYFHTNGKNCIESPLGHLPLLACPPAIIVTLPRGTAPYLAVIVPIFWRAAPQCPPANMEGGGGGGLPDNRENISQEDEGSDSDVISLLPAEELPGLPQESKFRVFQNIITKTSESLASPLPEDMASCFNTTYHKTFLAETSKVKELLTNTLRSENVDMIVRTTNNGLFSLKDPAMPNIRSRDAKLQETQGSLIKSSYITMKLAEDLAQAHAMSDQCIHSLTLNSVAVQQLDQVRRSAFKPVLPTHLKGLTKVPPSPHTELFGGDLPTRQKELKDKADLAESLGKSTEKPTSSNLYRPIQNQSRPYSRPTQSSTKPNWPQRRQQQDTRPQMRGQ